MEQHKKEQLAKQKKHTTKMLDPSINAFLHRDANYSSEQALIIGYCQQLHINPTRQQRKEPFFRLNALLQSVHCGLFQSAASLRATTAS